MDDDHDARTIHCGNLYAEKITEELLYELFVQAGPLERVAIPKDNGKNRQYAFVTYKYACSVPYAMSIFAGTKLFNRELRMNNRGLNRANNNNNNNESNQTRGQAAHVPPPVLSNIQPTHQFQMQNPFGNNALRGAGDNNQLRGSMNQMNSMLPSAPMQQMQFPPNSQIDFAMLLAQSAQMLSYANGLGANNSGNDNNDSQKRQSKMMHRNESYRSHNQNGNYSRDKDRRRNHSRSRSPDRNEWIRNQGRSNRRDGRDHRDRDRNQRNDNNRRRNDRR